MNKTKSPLSSKTPLALKKETLRDLAARTGIRAGMAVTSGGAKETNCICRYNPPLQTYGCPKK